jgi:hypothetical protein
VLHFVLETASYTATLAMTLSSVVAAKMNSMVALVAISSPTKLLLKVV